MLRNFIEFYICNFYKHLIAIKQRTCLQCVALLTGPVFVLRRSQAAAGRKSMATVVDRRVKWIGCVQFKIVFIRSAESYEKTNDGFEDSELRRVERC